MRARTPLSSPGSSTAGPPGRTSRRAAAVAVAALAALLAGGCSLGRSDFNGNDPDPSASKVEVVRTPSPVGTDLPYTDPPVLQPLPGPTGGLIGSAPTTAPPASPGQASDGGGGPAN